MVSVVAKVFILLIFFVGFLIWYKKFKTSPWYLNRLWRSVDEALRNHKITLFSSLPVMRERLNRDLEILELGCGGGVNFRYYPDGTKVTLIDINPEYNKFVDENLKSQNTQVEVKDYICCNAENLSQFADHSFDAVVCTYLLSSVKRSDHVVEEIRRVLNPEGIFYFIENVFGKIGDKARVVQRVLSPFYPFLFDGIKLIVHTDDVISNAGFAKVDFKRIEWEPPQPLLFALRSSICGTATKGVIESVPTFQYGDVTGTQRMTMLYSGRMCNATLTPGNDRPVAQFIPSTVFPRQIENLGKFRLATLEERTNVCKLLKLYLKTASNASVLSLYM